MFIIKYIFDVTGTGTGTWFLVRHTGTYYKIETPVLIGTSTGILLLERVEFSLMAGTSQAV